MRTKSKVLALLEEKKGKYISGELLAKTLGVSRNAVWKAVNELKSSGYEIKAVTNAGYSLSEESDIISAEAIAAELVGFDLPIKIEVFDELPSTNAYAKDLAVKNVPHGSIILAKTQTAGRGRLGRGFYSPPESGLYMSFILKPDKIRVNDPVFVTVLAAVAVSLAIETVYGKKTGIKWVNDLYHDGKKVCGILTEAAGDFETRSIDWIVLGIGVNITDGAFPEEIKNIAGSLLGGGKSHDKNRLVAEIIKNVFTAGDKAKILSDYKERLFILGKNITVHKGSTSFDAVALDIDENAALIVEKEGGDREVLFSGEVSIKL